MVGLRSLRELGPPYNLKGKSLRYERYCAIHDLFGDGPFGGV